MQAVIAGTAVGVAGLLIATIALEAWAIRYVAETFAGKSVGFWPSVGLAFALHSFLVATTAPLRRR